MANSVISPTLVLPASCNMLRNGKGNSRMVMSKNMLVAEWLAHIGKNVSGSFVPQPTHLPLRVGFQFLAIGWQGKRPSMKKQTPHMAVTMMTMQVILLAMRY